MGGGFKNRGGEGKDWVEEGQRGRFRKGGAKGKSEQWGGGGGPMHASAVNVNILLSH